MATVRIITPEIGPPFVKATFQAEGFAVKVFASSDIVCNWYRAVRYAINEILNGNNSNPWVSTDTRDFDALPIAADYMHAWLVLTSDGWDLKYQQPTSGRYVRVYVPLGRHMTYKELAAYCNSNLQPA